MGKIWYGMWTMDESQNTRKYVWSYPHNNISSDLLSVSGNYVISLCYVKLNRKIKYVRCCKKKKRKHRREENSREWNFERFWRIFIEILYFLLYKNITIVFITLKCFFLLLLFKSMVFFFFSELRLNLKFSTFCQLELYEKLY